MKSKSKAEIIEPKYVSLETAKMLNNAGFTRENGFACKAGWINYLTFSTGETKYPDDERNLVMDLLSNSHLIERPEQWQVVEWLRCEYGINVITLENYHYPMEMKKRWAYEIVNTTESDRIISNRNFIIKSDYEFISPKEAYEFAFQHILNKIIK